MRIRLRIFNHWLFLELAKSVQILSLKTPTKYFMVMYSLDCFFFVQKKLENNIACIVFCLYRFMCIELFGWRQFFYWSISCSVWQEIRTALFILKWVWVYIWTQRTQSNTHKQRKLEPRSSKIPGKQIPEPRLYICKRIDTVCERYSVHKFR